MLFRTLKFAAFTLLVITSVSHKIIGQSQEQSDIYHQFVFQYLEELNFGEPNNFVKAFDKDKFIDRVFVDIPSDTETMKEIRTEIGDGVKSNLDNVIRTIFQSFDSFDYVNYSEGEGYYTILIRGSGDEGGLNYLELELDIAKKEELRIIDIYSYFSGEYISTTMNRNVKMIISENGMMSKILSSLSLTDREYTESLPKLVKMEKYRNMGDFNEILKVYDTLPSSIKKEKTFLIVAISAAQSVDEERYLKLIKLYESEFPEDPSLPLLSLDYYLLRGEIETANKQVDKLDEIVGGDNYLNVIRSNICIIAEDKVCAKSHLETAIQNNEFEEEAYWGLLELELRDNNYKKVSSYLSLLSDNFGYEFTEEALGQVDIYKNYLKSEDFKEWNSSRN